MDTSCHVPRPKGLVGHEFGVPWRMRTRLTVTADLPSRLPEIFVAGILLLSEHWIFIMIMIILIVAAATSIELLYILWPTDRASLSPAGIVVEVHGDSEALRVHLWRGLGATCAPQHSSALSSVSQVDSRE